MRVIITGGLGFLGLQLTAALLKRGTLTPSDHTPTPIASIYLFDIPLPQLPKLPKDPRVKVVLGNITDAKVVQSLFDHRTPAEQSVSIFHLASIMSGEGEENFEKCLAVNLDGTRTLLECARRAGAAGERRPVFVFASSIAAYPNVEGVVGDGTKLAPLTTYGATKAICEVLVNEYTRKKFVDGRTVRLATVMVRPGKPNKASTSAFSGVIREPLNGDVCEIPLDPDLRHPIVSLRTVISGLVDIHELPEEKIQKLAGPDRGIQIPCFSATLRSMADTVREVMKEQGRGEPVYKWERDEKLNKIVNNMCHVVESERALRLGLKPNPGLKQIIQEYVEDFLPAAEKAPVSKL